MPLSVPCDTAMRQESMKESYVCNLWLSNWIDSLLYMSKGKQQTSDLWGIWRIRAHKIDARRSKHNNRCTYRLLSRRIHATYYVFMAHCLRSSHCNNFIGLRKWGKNGDLALSRFNQNQLKTYHGESFKIIIKKIWQYILLLGSWLFLCQLQSHTRQLGTHTHTETGAYQTRYKCVINDNVRVHEFSNNNHHFIPFHTYLHNILSDAEMWAFCDCENSLCARSIKYIWRILFASINEAKTVQHADAKSKQDGW